MMPRSTVPFLLRSAILIAILSSVSIFAIETFLKPAPDVLGAHIAPAVIASIPVGIGPDFNLVDSASNRVYVANRFGNTVSVIDTTTDTLIANVPVGFGPGELRLNSGISRLYVNNSDSGTVTIIDTITNTVITTVTVGTNPHRLRVNTALNRVYALNRGSVTVSIIDGSTNTDSVITTVTVGPDPQHLRINPVNDRVFVTNRSIGTVSIIDGATNVDAVITNVTVGTSGATPFDVRFSNNLNRAYVSNQNAGTVSVIDGATNIDAVITTVNVGSSPFRITVDQTTDIVYVANIASGTVHVIDGATNVDAVINNISVGGNPQKVRLNTAANRAYVAARNSNSVAVIDTATNTLLAAIPVGNQPRDTRVNPNTNRIYVNNRLDDTISIIDGATNTVTDTVSVGFFPVRARLDLVSDRLYVSNLSDDTVSVIGDTPASTTVKVPLLTEVFVGPSGLDEGDMQTDVLGVPGGDLGAYQFQVSYDPAVITVANIVADVFGGDAPFNAVTAVNLTNPATGSEVVEWNHFQGEQTLISTGVHKLAGIAFQPVGVPGECTDVDITVVALVDNDGVAIPNSGQDGQVCLVFAPGSSETDLVAAQDVDNVDLPTGVTPVINLIKNSFNGDPQPLRLISSYEANITYPTSGEASAIATGCILKSPFTSGPSDCTILNGQVHLRATTGVTGSGVVAPVDPLAFVALRLLGSNDPVDGLTTVDLNFISILDDLGEQLPQEIPPDSRTFLRGDAQANGFITIGDALFIAQHIVAPLFRPTGEGVGEINPVNSGSVNHDSPDDVISLADAIRIAQLLVGIRDEFYDPQ
jgi:YVTN family beta-propeller protein